MKGTQFDAHRRWSWYDQTRQMEERGQSLPGRMSKALWEIVVSGPHHHVCERDLEHGHHLILPIVEFVHRSFMRREVFKRAQQVTLLATIALALLMLAVTGLVDFPLPSLVFLDLSIGHGFFLLDGFTQQPAFRALLLQLDLMIIEDTVEGSGPFFGEPAPLRVEFTRIVGTLACSICPPLHIGEPLLQSGPFLGDLRILDTRLRKPVIRIQTQGEQE